MTNHTPIDQRAMLNRMQQTTQKINQQNGTSSPLSKTPGSLSHSQSHSGKSFEAVLAEVQEQQITISKHARERLNSRAVNLSESDMQKVSRAMDQASKKGIKDAVIIINDQVLIANIPNKTIITASNKSDLNSQIITNINGAILI